MYVFICCRVCDFPAVLIRSKFNLYSYDDKTACQMILDKRGLKGYQVIQITMNSCVLVLNMLLSDSSGLVPWRILPNLVFLRGMIAYVLTSMQCLGVGEDLMKIWAE